MFPAITVSRSIVKFTSRMLYSASGPSYPRVLKHQGTCVCRCFVLAKEFYDN